MLVAFFVSGIGYLCSGSAFQLPRARPGDVLADLFHAGFIIAVVFGSDMLLLRSARSATALSVIGYFLVGDWVLSLGWRWSCAGLCWAALDARTDRAELDDSSTAAAPADHGGAERGCGRPARILQLEEAARATDGNLGAPSNAVEGGLRRGRKGPLSQKRATTVIATGAVRGRFARHVATRA